MAEDTNIEAETAANRAGMTVADLDEWAGAFANAEKHRKPWVDNANAAKNYRIARANTDSFDGDDPSRRNRLTVNLLQLRYLGRVASQVARDPTFHCFGTKRIEDSPGSAGYRVKVNEGYLKHHWRKGRLKRMMREVAADGVDYSRGACMVDYISQPEMIPVLNAPKVDEEEASPGPGEQDLIRFENRLVADSVHTFRVDPRRVLWDPAFNKPLDSPWIAIEFQRDRESILKERWLNPSIVENIAAMSLEDMSERNDISEEQRRAIAARGHIFDLYDVWDKRTGKRLTFIKGFVTAGPIHARDWLSGLEKKKLVESVDERGRTILRKIVTERRYPIEFYEPRADNDEPFTRPDAQDLIGLQKGIIQLYRLSYDQQVAQIPRLVFPDAEVSQKEIDEFLLNPNRRAIKMSNPKAIEWVTAPQMGGSLKAAADSFKMTFDEQATMPANSRGMPSEHQISATEAAISEGGQQAITGLDQDELEDMMTRLAELQLMVAAGNLRTPFQFAVHAGQGIKQFEITGEDLDPDCIIQIERNGTRYYDREYMEQKTVGRVQAYMQTFANSVGPSEVRRLKELMLDEFGWLDEGILNPVPEQYQPFLAKVEELLASGMAPDQIFDALAEEIGRADADLDEAENTALLRGMRDQNSEIETALQVVESGMEKPQAPPGGQGGQS
ncbi:MAG: hypothetical protein GY700_06315 [Propionibacteriaceae bacterium]|nr:hypothetical protein [Propionibacteriaceae bacterium]